MLFRRDDVMTCNVMTIVEPFLFRTFPEVIIVAVAPRFVTSCLRTSGSTSPSLGMTSHDSQCLQHEQNNDRSIATFAIFFVHAHTKSVSLSLSILMVIIEDLFRHVTFHSSRKLRRFASRRLVSAFGFLSASW